MLSGTGDVIEPDGDAAAVGSGGSFALAAARALAENTTAVGARDRRAGHEDRRRDLHLHQRPARLRRAVAHVDAPRCARPSRLTPRAIVEELDRYIVGQKAAKRAVAVALRNRWRRQQVPPPAARRDRPQEHHDDRPHRRGQDRDRPPPGQAGRRPLRQGGGLQVHRGRLRRPRRRLDGARPGRDRRLHAARRGARAGARPRARENAEERLLDVLLPPAPPQRRRRSPMASMLPGPSAWRLRPTGRAASRPPPPADNATRESLRRLLREGKLDDRTVEIDTADTPHLVHRRLLRHRHGGDGPQPARHVPRRRPPHQAPPPARCPRRWRRSPRKRRAS